MDPLVDADRYRQRVETALLRWLTLPDAPSARLLEAMRYGVLGTGKRIRPLLCYLTGETLGLPAARLDAPACAVEIIHAYSLIHDDLPAMDNDDLRRGRPTCHRAFDEATAILAGDALQVLAFQVLATDPTLDVDADARLEMIRLLATASGPLGMAGGQAMDLQSQGRTPDAASLAAMHRRKTGALIGASVMMPAAAAGPLPATTLDALRRFADCVGLAFQVQDDILDVAGDTAVLGKRSGADAAADKVTYPALLGLEGARTEARRLTDEAIRALEPLGEAARPLRALAEAMAARNH